MKILALLLFLFSFNLYGSEQSNHILSIMDQFFKIERQPRGKTGTLPTETLRKLAATEEREADYYGKDNFWRTILAQRKQEEEAESMIKRLQE